MSLVSVNPTTGEVVSSYHEMPMEEVARILVTAQAAQSRWKDTPFGDRAEPMRTVATSLRKRKNELARLMAIEMGKIVAAGESEVEKCAWVCEYFAENAEKFLQPEFIATEAAKSYVTFRPLGLVLAVMPWNFPFWQVFRCIAPALMAGNGCVLKHASNVQGCALAIEEIVTASGFPKSLFRTLVIGSGMVPQIIGHPLIAGVAFTGSTHAGRLVASAAGSFLKKTVLELGGSDAYVILKDADMELAVRTCVSSRLINSGQSCIAAKRFIVVEPVLHEFEERMTAQMKKVIMGDPIDPMTQLGPLARADLRQELHRQVAQSVDRGAICTTGGKIMEGKGTFYPPTVLTRVEKGMPAHEEELFGPVAAIIQADNEESAIRIANDTRFGLGAAVFTSDMAIGEQIAATGLDAGQCVVNTAVKSDPRLPFGGVKESGYGRELSHYGLKEFMNIKVVYIG